MAVDKIRKADGYSGAPIHPLVMDVSSLQSVQKAAKIYMQQHSDKLDMLFLNAGIYTAASEFDSNSPLTLSKDGIEMVFATNVLGHHLLYKLLQPILFKSNMARVVLTSSFMSYTSFDYGVATDIQTLNTGDSSLQHSVKVYGQSKLAQIMLVKSMVKQLQQDNVSNVYVNAANPGIVRTPMQYRHSVKKSNPPLVNTITKWIQDKQNMWNATEGALTPLFLGVATNDIQHMNINGRYYSPMAVEASPPTIALNKELQEKVWKFCNDLVKDYVVQERSD